jgi:hypothetical protein
MPVNANVFINHGPYKSNGIVEHRTDRLQGLKSSFKLSLFSLIVQIICFLKAYLESKGHKIVLLNKTECWNNVEILVNQESVFKCKIQELEFGGDGELDSLVIAAENAVREAY